MRVSVVGGSTVTDREAAVAEAVGREIADRDHELVCGGLGGAMRAACRGASEADGHTVGILPGRDRTAANRYVDTAVATGLGHGRNAMVALNGDGVVAVDGGPGTLSEIALAAVYGRPVAGLSTHDVEYVHAVDSAAAALDYVEEHA
ncbi:TIGR00725 family protein [Halobacteriales archaeon QS_8_69_26]|nr:MAG: TIGR00725 family protein [Halobacteriales archaeon QS_8_69_26]